MSVIHEVNIELVSHTTYITERLLRLFRCENTNPMVLTTTGRYHGSKFTQSYVNTNDASPYEDEAIDQTSWTSTVMDKVR